MGYIEARRKTPLMSQRVRSLVDVPGLSFSEVGEILQLLQGIEDADIDLEWGDLKIQVRHGRSVATAANDLHPSPERDVSETSPHDATNKGDSPEVTKRPTASDDSAPVPTAGESPIPDHWAAVSAPMAGTFYRAPSPEEAPFVEVGDTVSAGQTVALIEVMKLFTELKAEISGKVARIDALDGELAEFGAPLVWIEPA